MARSARLLGLILAVALAHAPAQAQARRGGVLATRLDRLLDEEPFNRALWGVAIADPSGHMVFERNGDRLFVPASNTKLVVAAVAAALLPPDYRFRTSVYGAGPIGDSVLHGDLILYGRGDPTLSARYYPTRLTPFEELADSLRARGVARVEGDLVGDASYFDSVATHPSWEAYDLTWSYAAPVTALGFNDNSVDFDIAPGAAGQPPVISLAPNLGVVQFTNRARTVPADSARTIEFYRQPGTNVVWAEGDVPVDARPWTANVAVVDGPAWAATAFRAVLASRGIAVTGRVRTVYDSTTYAAARRMDPLAEHRSPPLPKVLEPILSMSHNWYAEMLLKTIGREVRGRGSWEAGLDVERRFLIDSLRVDSTMFHLADGSGLSHHNLVAPDAFVRLLRAMRERPAARAFLDALPRGGEGTLRYRFRRAPLAGRVRAKTGSIGTVNTLSGYLETPGGVWTFSIQLNNHTAREREALQRLDAIVAALGR